MSAPATRAPEAIAEPTNGAPHSQPTGPNAGQRVAPVQITGAEAVVRSLEELGVDLIFGIPGGAVLPVYDPLFDSTKLRHVLVRHEQGAGHAASGYAHATGRVGVMMATSGPGATNLVTPLADAQMDSIPVVAITGQVGRALIGTDAFQESDITGITMPITKHNILVRDGDDIARSLAEAFHIASTGRHGAVLVDIPKDVLQGQCTFSWPPQLQLPGYKPNTKPHARQIKEAAKLITEALGCVGLRCEREEDVVDVINQARAINDRPVVIDFIVGADAQVWPMVAAGTGNDEIMAARNIRPLFDEDNSEGRA